MKEKIKNFLKEHGFNVLAMFFVVCLLSILCDLVWRGAFS